MHDFDYVNKAIYGPEQAKLVEIIHQVQDILRDRFTFQYEFIGSTQLNMITQDKKSNVGYDFDVNLYPNDDEEKYEAWEIKHMFMNAFNQIVCNYGYSYCEDSTSVFTIKTINYLFSSIIHSCDFAIVYKCSDGQQQYIRFNKNTRQYTWEFRGKGYNLERKIKWLRKTPMYWNEVRDLYLYKKNYNENLDKKSRSLRAEAINEVAKRYGYKD